MPKRRTDIMRSRDKVIRAKYAKYKAEKKYLCSYIYEMLGKEFYLSVPAIIKAIARAKGDPQIAVTTEPVNEPAPARLVQTTLFDNP